MDSNATKFATIYNRFLGKITDDMYMELTPEDTLRDLHSLLIQALPQFEFPRKNLFDYEESIIIINGDEILEDDFFIGVVWEDLENADSLDRPQRVIVDRSIFNAELTAEEIEILAILMMIGWVQRQVTSIEHTRMKYSGTDFKMTSQANHLQKLLSVLSECQRQSIHTQRLYKRRRLENNVYRSNWDVFDRGVYYNGRQSEYKL